VRTLRGFSRFERYLAKSVSTFVYISKAVEELYQQLGIPAEKGKIVYNPIDVDRFDQNGANLRLRTELGLTDQHRLVSNVGRVEWWKGQDYFVEAMAEVIKQEPNARGLIVGQADTSQRSRIYYQRLQGLIQELNLSNYVIETGFRQDVPQIMAASDVIVHSASEPEPFGRVVVEAMAAGRPVIATAAGGVLDIIEDQVNGRLIPCKDATAMATAICEFLRDLGLSERIGQQAKQDAKRRFSVAQHVTVVQQIYDKLLDMPGKVSVVAGD
jgi:glycosyltransferase involved in cell wall biosynthesis